MIQVYTICDLVRIIHHAISTYSRLRLCLSGTPMENNLGEIWRLFHFLMPGFLGSQKRFTELFRKPIEKQSDPEAVENQAT
ncbi:MAG: SNF2-related protein, partial [Rhodoferax sp.]|nr:SNF2-related protein [Rhodoferax sp.]